MCYVGHMTVFKWTAFVIGAVTILLLLAALLFRLVVNPAVMEEIRANPNGDEAREAMILTYDDRTLPVNYLREGNQVFMGVDGPWWRSFQGDGKPVTMVIKGETLTGHGIVVLDDDDYVEEVFSRLRPTAPEWLPLWLNGRLVVITLSEAG